jgi:hypothetical protein
MVAADKNIACSTHFSSQGMMVQNSPVLNHVVRIVESDWLFIVERSLAPEFEKSSSSSLKYLKNKIKKKPFIKP